MHVLVMGGTEFVSAALARYLVAKDYDVDILTRGLRPIDCDGIRTHLKGDRRSPESLQSALGDREYDAVFDISAYTKEDAEILYHALNGRRLRSWIFCSSGAVYLPSDELVNEAYPRGANPHWGEYGLRKKEAEDYLLQMHREEELPVTIFRPTYIYGRGNNLYREAYLFDRVEKGLKIPIPESGIVGNQFVHIDDLVRTFESAIDCAGMSGKAFNLTRPEIITWRGLIDTVMEIVGRDVEVVEVSEEDMKIDGIEAREFFPFRHVTYTLDIAHLQNTSLFVPTIDLKEGLARTYAWYRAAKPVLHDPRLTKVEEVLRRMRTKEEL